MDEQGSVRWKGLVAGAICLAGIAALLFGVLRSNIVYYRTVPEAIAVAESEDRGGRFRLGGIVVEGSIRETASDAVEFELTDGTKRIRVRNLGSPPDLFREGESVLCEGRFDDDAIIFESDKITIRHGNEYAAPGASSSIANPGADA